MFRLLLLRARPYDVMPHSCSCYDMSEASMQYESGAGGAGEADVLPASGALILVADLGL